MTFLCGNPRYHNYARAHGRTPAEQYVQDKQDWPGGHMVGFTQWNRARLVEASKEIPEAFFIGQLTDAEAYDAWLTEWVDKKVKE
jgi:hypothetical protein